VSIALDWRGTELGVDVADDGRGPGLGPVTGGRGLIGMRERVHAFGGTLDTTTGEDGAGFRVSVGFPLRAGTEAAGG
jgi:signal transduction histidine kinase